MYTDYSEICESACMNDCQVSDFSFAWKKTINMTSRLYAAWHDVAYEEEIEKDVFHA